MPFRLDAREASRSLAIGVTNERCQVGDAISHCATRVTELTLNVCDCSSRVIYYPHPGQKESADKARRRRRRQQQARPRRGFFRACAFSPMEFN